MAITIRTSEVSDDSDHPDAAPLTFAPYLKTFRRRKRAFFAAATLLSLLLLTFYLTIQYRAPDWFVGDSELLPLDPEDVEPPSNVAYPVVSHYSGVRGPPTPFFRGARPLVAMNRIFHSPNLDNLLPDKQYITSWPSAGWSEFYCCPRPFIPYSSPYFSYVVQ